MRDQVGAAPRTDGEPNEADLSSLASFGRFARVPYGAGRDKRVSYATLRILLALAERADNSGSCWPSIAILARDAACTRRTAQRALRTLERTGYTSTIRGGMVNGRRMATQYTLVYRPDTRTKTGAPS